MDEFFPPDVRLRIEGDAPATAIALRGATRRVLFLALLLQERYADGRPVLLQQQIGPSSYAKVFLHEGQKIVTIYSYASPDTPEPIPEELTPETFVPSPGLYLGLLNGWWKDGTLVTTTSGTTVTTRFSSYKPTAATALVQGLGTGFADNERLHGETTLFWASGYTGSLKRVVQAIWALGEINIATTGYISGAPVTPQKRTPTLNFPQQYSQSVGLFKAGSKNHWLVEIGYRGIIAMPLPTFDFTRTAAYRNKAALKGDTDTIVVLDEFGGLPTGEGLPDDSALPAAIAAGKVIQLLSAADMTQPLRLSPYTTTHQSWAFSENGSKADNVGWHYELPGRNWTDGDKITDAGKVGYTAVRVAYGEHWRVAISLSTHNLANLTAPTPSPVGTGSATVTLVQRGKLDPRAMFDMWKASGSSGQLTRPLPSFWKITTIGVPPGQIGEGTSECELPVPPGMAHALNPCLNDGWGCNVHVWYEGERLYRVRWTCYKQIYEHTESHAVSSETVPRWGVANWYWNVYSPKAFVVDSLPDLRIAAGQQPRNPDRVMAEAPDGHADMIYDAAGAAARVAADQPFTFSPGGAGGSTALLRDFTFVSIVLILPLGMREGCMVLRDLQGYNVGESYADFAAQLHHDALWERWLVGRFNGIGELHFIPPPLDSITVPSTDRQDVVAWADRSPYLSGPPNSNDTPQPRAMVVVNAGPSRQWGAYNGLILSTSAYRLYWNEHVPTELQTYNPLKFGWLGSVP